MPGFFTGISAPVSVPTPEELEEMRRDGMNPLTGDALAEALAKSGPEKGKGLDFSKYVPPHFMERTMRMRQANFNGFEYDRLSDMMYHETIAERWMKRADQKAEADYGDKHG